MAGVASGRARRAVHSWTVHAANDLGARTHALPVLVLVAVLVFVLVLVIVLVGAPPLTVRSSTVGGRGR
jgi:hypothetical protein